MRRSENWGGKRPNTGPKPGPRKGLNLSTEAAESLWLLTKHQRAVLGKPNLTQEDVIAGLVEEKWQDIQREYEPAEEMKEPYIL